MGPKYGYYPKLSKSILVLKKTALMAEAKQLLADTGVQISCHGQRHLRAAIGSADFRCKYITSKGGKCINDLSQLAKCALEEPQAAALVAYTKSICNRWTFIRRTISIIKDLFLRLEDCIRNVFIPSLIERTVSDLETQMLSLPVRFGGMGLTNPVETADREYSSSRAVTASLSQLILQQDQDISHYDKQRTANIIKGIKSSKENYLSEKFQDLANSIRDNSLKR